MSGTSILGEKRQNYKKKNNNKLGRWGVKFNFGVHLIKKHIKFKGFFLKKKFKDDIKILIDSVGEICFDPYRRKTLSIVNVLKNFIFLFLTISVIIQLQA